MMTASATLQSNLQNVDFSEVIDGNYKFFSLGSMRHDSFCIVSLGLCWPRR